MSQMTSRLLFLSGPVPARLVPQEKTINIPGGGIMRAAIPEISRDSRQGREVTRDSMN